MSWGRLAAENFRGARLPRVLGLVLAAATLVSSVLVAAVSEVGAAGWGALAGSVLVFTAGLVDDLVPIGPRGLRNHLRSLAAGRMTTGILKLLVIAASSGVMVALQPVHGGWTRVAGVVLLAGAANVWNGLDVAPGRALKAFLPVGLVLPAAGIEPGLVPVLPGLVAGAALCLPFDLRERAMLGDGGANLLGLGAGLGLYLALPAWCVWVAAGAAVLLNVLADTVTLSRMIDRAPPLRWLDRLGRLPA